MAKSIEDIVDWLIFMHPSKWEQAKKKPELLNWFVGKVMKQKQGFADPERIKDILKGQMDEQP